MILLLVSWTVNNQGFWILYCAVLNLVMGYLGYLVPPCLKILETPCPCGGWDCG